MITRSRSMSQARSEGPQARTDNSGPQPVVSASNIAASSLMLPAQEPVPVQEQPAPVLLSPPRDEGAAVALQSPPPPRSPAKSDSSPSDDGTLSASGSLTSQLDSETSIDLAIAKTKQELRDLKRRKREQMIVRSEDSSQSEASSQSDGASSPQEQLADPRSDSQSQERVAEIASLSPKRSEEERKRIAAKRTIRRAKAKAQRAGVVQEPAVVPQSALPAPDDSAAQSLGSIVVDQVGAAWCLDGFTVVENRKKRRASSPKPVSSLREKVLLLARELRLDDHVLTRLGEALQPKHGGHSSEALLALASALTVRMSACPCGTHCRRPRTQCCFTKDGVRYERSHWKTLEELQRDALANPSKYVGSHKVFFDLVTAGKAFSVTLALRKTSKVSLAQPPAAAPAPSRAPTPPVAARSATPPAANHVASTPPPAAARAASQPTVSLDTSLAANLASPMQPTYAAAVSASNVPSSTSALPHHVVPVEALLHLQQQLLAKTPQGPMAPSLTSTSSREVKHSTPNKRMAQMLKQVGDLLTLAADLMSSGGDDFDAHSQ